MALLKNSPDSPPSGGRWPLVSALFPSLRSDQARVLQDFPQILEQVWPLNKARRKSLPYDIRDLSRVLTSHRSDLKKPYWMKPAWISAYLYYFLPWNLVRLIRLFNGPTLPEPDFRDRPLLIDGGSGPLSAPIALWIAKPEWRKEALKIMAVDTSRQPLELGLKIFNALRGSRDASPWDITIAADPLWRLFYAFRKRMEKMDANPWLIIAANVLNESIQFERREDKEEDEDDDALSKILMAWDNFREYPSFRGILAIEPGTRLGGATIMELRKRAIEMGYSPLSPCVASNPCPLLRKKSGQSGALSEKWCHFTFDASDAPSWLERLSEEAGLAKKSLSLSLALLSSREGGAMDPLARRVISHTFPVPGLSPACRYGCSSEGLCLLPNSRKLPSGALTRGVVPQKPYRDKRSDAIALEPAPRNADSKNGVKQKFPREKR